MPENYKISFEDKKGKAITDEILITADSQKQAIREACRVGNVGYPPKYRIKLKKVDLLTSPPPEKKGEAKSTSVQE